MITLNFFIRTTAACFALLIIGMIFKTMHWPGSNSLIVGGGVGFATFLFLTIFSIDFNKIQKNIRHKSTDIDLEKFKS
jgi:hypothetical protein